MTIIVLVVKIIPKIELITFPWLQCLSMILRNRARLHDGYWLQGQWFVSVDQHVFLVCVCMCMSSLCVCVCGVCLVFWWSLCISFMSCISCSLGLGFSTIAWCVKWTGLYFMRTPCQWHLRTDHWWCSILKFFFKYVLEFHFSCECFFERSLLRCTFPMISQLLYQQYGGFRKWGYP